ncbi:MAG: sugar phosphate nucleotidyltransferase [Christensenellales bacterium]|jgi:mannose-1-phosphate guanylyltransferase/phosphomannomutase
MKAIIMAGGEGTRLRPLTCDCPKPMMRLIDKPVMEYALGLLARHGVTDAAVTLGYLPERISDYFGDGAAFGVNLRYYTERTPLGTAGGVKQARVFLDETFCVLSGDGVTDADLTEALAFHRAHAAKATMILKRVKNPMAYGLVMTAPDGRITRFYEKPGWGEVISDAVNTGIYILEPEVLDLVPEGAYDFGRELFPRMAAEGGLYGCVTEGYWCDIGDIEAYLEVCRDALEGKIRLPGLEELGGVRTDRAAVIHESAQIESPCYIAPGATVGKNAKIGAHSVIGRGARVGEYATIKRGVLWSEARLEEGAQARGCVLARGAALGPCASAYENCVLGAGAQVGADAELLPGVSVWPGKRVPDATVCDANVIWGAAAQASAFQGGAMRANTPTEALRIAQAYAAQMKPREALLARAPSAVASAIWHGCAAGLMAQGVRVIDAGICTEPQLRFALALMKVDGALLAGTEWATPYAADGCRLSIAQQRAVSALMARQDYPQPFSGITHPVTSSGRSEHAYVAMLASAFSAKAEGAPGVAVHANDPYLLSLAERAYQRTGLSMRAEWEDEMMELGAGEIGVWLEDGGASATLGWENERLSEPEMQLLHAWVHLEHGEKQLVCGLHMTRAIEELAARYDAQVQYAGAARPVWERALAQAHPEQFRTATDGIHLSLLAVAALIDRSMTLADWRASMPQVHRMTRAVRLDDDMRGQVMRTLAENDRDIETEGGLWIRREGGWAWIAPDETRPECRIVTEALSAEFASELCDFCETTLKKAIEESGKG